MRRRRRSRRIFCCGADQTEWTYLLVADSEEDDAECLILKDTSTPEEKDSVYEMVEEEVELNAVLKVFEELLEDVEIEV